MARIIELTQDGYTRLEAQLAQERKRLDEAIRILSEITGSQDDFDDSSLEDAKNEKNLIELRIDNLEDQLARAEIIKNHKRDKADIGAVVSLHDTKNKEDFDVQLVNSIEASVIDLDIPKISDESPLGQALKDRKKGETFVVNTGKKSTEYKIVAIR